MESSGYYCVTDKKGRPYIRVSVEERCDQSLTECWGRFAKVRLSVGEKILIPHISSLSSSDNAVARAIARTCQKPHDPRDLIIAALTLVRIKRAREAGSVTTQGFYIGSLNPMILLAIRMEQYLRYEMHEEERGELIANQFPFHIYEVVPIGPVDKFIETGFQRHACVGFLAQKLKVIRRISLPEVLDHMCSDENSSDHAIALASYAIVMAQCIKNFNFLARVLHIYPQVETSPKYSSVFNGNFLRGRVRNLQGCCANVNGKLLSTAWLRFTRQ